MSEVFLEIFEIVWFAEGLVYIILIPNYPLFPLSPIQVPGALLPCSFSKPLSPLDVQ